uniref:Uncharacterized protein n=1 Tax=Anguilla anguilla TaxID=7936 RepID=A0A0E9VQ37_ANGAN
MFLHLDIHLIDALYSQVILSHNTKCKMQWVNCKHQSTVNLRKFTQCCCQLGQINNESASCVV